MCCTNELAQRYARSHRKLSEVYLSQATKALGN